MMIECKVHCDLQNRTRTSVNRTFTRVKYQSQRTNDLYFLNFIKRICERSECFLGPLLFENIQV